MPIHTKFSSEPGSIRTFPFFGISRTVSMLLLVTFVITGCASLEGKLTSSQVADTAYFTDQTISMLSSARLQMQKDESLYTKEYWDDDDPDEKAVLDIEAEVIDVFRSIIEYSLALVNISDSLASESQKVQRYADWFGPWKEEYFDRVGMNEQQYDATIANIRRQQDLRGAFLAAQPLLNALNYHTNNRLDDLIVKADIVARKTDAKIDADFADVIRYQEKLEAEKYRILEALEDLYDTYSGQEGAYERLKSSQAIRRKDLLPPQRPNDDQIEQIGQHLLARLEALHLVGQQIEPDWETYRAAHRELDEMHTALLNDVTAVRIMILIWVHAHYQLASGRTEPAEWFDIKDATTAALKLAF